ncbi:peroxiredoxin [Chelativorans sp. Marseille-P2723]|uniref:peroxiredoxin n=1 Tax=Chelativorans sp. Marseille-P2723 TaxID=2709133 RepID=UPI00156D469A|nr:peroxiredoxin [Chelativorans sp. Marseille-P2723]
MTISVGQKVPDETIRKATPDGAEELSTADFFSGRKIVLFGVPGAFTPTCSNSHVPGFVENHDAIRARGVDAIAVLAVNDQHVMGAWARFTGAEDKLVFLADGNGTFTRALGLNLDLTAGGLGTRCKRFSMIVEDGIVKELNVEEAPGKVVSSGAARILEQL